MSLQVLLNGVISKYMQICYVFFDEFLGIDSRNFFDVQRFLTSMFVRFERPSAEVVLIYRCACCCCEHERRWVVHYQHMLAIVPVCGWTRRRQRRSPRCFDGWLWNWQIQPVGAMKLIQGRFSLPCHVALKNKRWEETHFPNVRHCLLVTRSSACWSGRRRLGNLGPSVLACR